MAKSCCVDGCIAKDVVYFRFPNSRTQCKKWIEAIKLTGKPTYNSVICSDHFRPDDYGVVRGKVRLKAKVVPLSQNEQQKPNQTVQNNNPINRENTDNPDNRKGSNCGKEEEKTEERNSIEGISNGHGREDIVETEDIDEDDRPLSEHTRDTVKNLSESINQVDLNANTNLSTDKDIEDMLTYYAIKQNKEVANRQTEELNREKQRESERMVLKENVEEGNIVDLSTQENEPEPVFIEVAVNEEQNNRDTGSPRDCLMLLESVQVELDPNELMMSDVDDGGAFGNQPEEPISLLTSSDEDDVIIEEPHIDTVEVSDATDEDDVPLMQLVPKTPKLRPRWRAPNPFYRKDGWGTYQYFCPQCNYRTPSKAKYQAHTIQHSTVILVCHRCAYTTSSKAQYTRHMRKHSDDRRHQCHLCSYKARHQMSLVYHLKCHESVGDQCNKFKCDKCGYVSSVKRYLTRHVLLCTARHSRVKSKVSKHEAKRRPKRSKVTKLKKKRSQ